MTNEELERKMEFIVEHQAQFASDIQQLGDAQARTEQNLVRTEQVVSGLANVVDQGLRVTQEGFRDVNAKIDVLVNSQIALTQAQSRTEENLKNTDAKIDALVDSQIALTEAQSRTDENLKRTDENLKRTDENLKRTDENLKRTDENLKDVNAKIEALTQAQSRTEENINRTGENLKNLIALVDRYLREGRNGESRR